MVTAQVATIPERIASFQRVVESLLPQVDLLRVMLNNFNFDGMAAQMPPFLDNPKIEVNFCDNSLMDGYKFLKADQNTGHTFICDDDILYPADFVQTMIGHHNNFGGVLSIMGKNMKPPIISYANDEHQFFRVFQTQSQFNRVNLIGMCGAVYHSDEVTLNERDMVVTDSDVCASAYCIRNAIPMHVVPHAATWCQDLMQILPAGTKTMWLRNKLPDNDKLITDFINSRWSSYQAHDDLGR